MSGWSSVTFDDKARRIIEEMKAAEARHMSERHAQEEECACKGGMFPARAPANRRAFLFAAGSTAGGAAAAVLGGAARAASRKPRLVRSISMFRPIRPRSTASVSPGTAATDHAPNSKPRSARGFRPPRHQLMDLHSARQDARQSHRSGLHFERHHGGIPTIDPPKHMLLVHGMVDGPRNSRRRSQAVSVRHPQAFYRMLGQRPYGMEQADAEDRARHARPAQYIEWTGVRFATIAREVGLKDGGAWVLAEGADAAS